MPNSFKLKANILEMLNSELKKKLKNLSFLKAEAVQEIAELTKDQIVERTLGGQGAEDGKTINFKAYDKKYAEKRKGAGLPTKPVDLFFTGHMLTQLSIQKLTGKGFTIAVHKDDKGKWRGAHEGVIRKDGIVRRPFLDLSHKDLQALKPKVSKIVEREFKKELKKS